MSYSIKDTASLFGISIRTLHYYDEIGLLSPRKNPENNYRFYVDEDLARLEQILFFRELQFSLKEIALILGHPDYDRDWILCRQKELLIEKRDQLNKIISHIDSLLGNCPNMFEMDNKGGIDLKEKYANEVRERWGNTDAYQEYSEKNGSLSSEIKDEIQREADALFMKFAEIRHGDPSSDVAFALVREWQDHISYYHYQCSKQILSCLGQMYISDDRFRENLDYYGEGTAEFMAKAIELYCKE